MRNEELFAAAANFSLFTFHFYLFLLPLYPKMTTIRKTNIILALVALVLAILCVLSVVKS